MTSPPGRVDSDRRSCPCPGGRGYAHSAEQRGVTPGIIGSEYLGDPDLRVKLQFGGIRDKDLVRGIAINLLDALEAAEAERDRARATAMTLEEQLAYVAREP